MQNAILTRIASKFQVTVPPEIREIFDLHEGDLFQWVFDAKDAKLYLIPKRAQLITPLTEAAIRESRARRERVEQPAGKKEIAAHAG
ncbi:MAG: AbrB/MazE/SpoVT family DNA-binding domain-containing protein [Terriglobales bacterium]|jgi:AbrB family looped-hinge helix DNA binding protein